MTEFDDRSNDDLDDEIRERDEKQDAETELLAKVAAGDEAAITEYAERFHKNHLAFQDSPIAFFARLQEESQAAWLMLRQSLQQVGVKIAGVDKLIKQLNNEKLAKEARERAKRAAEGPSPAELKRRAKEKNDLRAALWSKCADIAKSPTLMADFVSVAHRYGVVSEDHAITTTYLSATSRLATKNAFNVAREGAAAAGKSFVTDSVLDFIPKESVIELTTASPLSLIYMGGDDVDFLKHKIVSVAEAVALAEKKDGSEPNPFATQLRNLISKGFIVHQVVVLQKKGPPITVTYVRNGPIVVMLTTARDNIDDELRTRLTSTKADESRDHTVEVVKRSFSTNANAVAVEELAAWIDLQRWLALDGPYEVVIPYLDAIGAAFNSRANSSAGRKEYPLRVRRDAAALKAAIGASAILHKAQREVHEDRRIVATIDDYRLAHSVIDSSAAEAHHLVIPETALAVVEAMEKLGANGPAGAKVTVRALQGKLGVSSTSVTAARLFEAIEAGLIEIVEHPFGKSYFERSPRYYKTLVSSENTKELIKTGRELCVFPTADEVARACTLPQSPTANSETAEQNSAHSELRQSVHDVSSVSSNVNRAEINEAGGEQAAQEPPLFDDEINREPLSPAPLTENTPSPVLHVISENNRSETKPGWRGRI
jgi:hypothetical protein